MKQLLLLFLPFVSLSIFIADASAQCASGTCSTAVMQNPTPDQLAASGYMRIVRDDGSAFWARPRNGTAVDSEGRTYAVPVRAALKEGFGRWRAAPRLQVIPAGDVEDCQASTSAPGAPGQQGPRGAKGDKGDPGESGADGAEAEVDYDRVQSMIAAVVSESVMQLEDRLLERMAADERFRGSPGQIGSTGPSGPAGPPGDPTAVNLDALAEQVLQRLPPITVRNLTETGEVIEVEQVPLGGTLNLKHKRINRPQS